MAKTELQRKHDFVVTVTLPIAMSAGDAKNILGTAIEIDRESGISSVIVRHADAYVRGKVSRVTRNLNALRTECNFAIDTLERACENSGRYSDD